MPAGKTAPFEETSQQWRAVGKTASDLNLRPPAPETNALPLDDWNFGIMYGTWKVLLHNRLHVHTLADYFGSKTLAKLALEMLRSAQASQLPVYHNPNASTESFTFFHAAIKHLVESIAHSYKKNVCRIVESSSFTYVYRSLIFSWLILWQWNFLNENISLQLSMLCNMKSLSTKLSGVVNS